MDAPRDGVARPQPERPADRDPASGARGIIRDTCADGAYRFHWSVIPSEEPLPIAAGRTGGLARARSIAEAALRAYAADFRMHTEMAGAEHPISDAHSGRES
jgi:hypothetical protein